MAREFGRERLAWRGAYDAGAQSSLQGRRRTLINRAPGCGDTRCRTAQSLADMTMVVECDAHPQPRKTKKVNLRYVCAPRWSPCKAACNTNARCCAHPGRTSGHLSSALSVNTGLVNARLADKP